MGYSLDNALFHWEEGERRLREAPEPARPRLDGAAGAVVDELRRRLGSSFTIEELAQLYAIDIDWAGDLALREAARGDSSWVVDAAFNRYAREATNFAGGRRRAR